MSVFENMPKNAEILYTKVNGLKVAIGYIEMVFGNSHIPTYRTTSIWQTVFVGNIREELISELHTFYHNNYSRKIAEQKKRLGKRVHTGSLMN